MENPEKCSINASFSGRVYHCENGHPGKDYEIEKNIHPWLEQEILVEGYSVKQKGG